jgi:hypothetical protein
MLKMAKKNFNMLLNYFFTNFEIPLMFFDDDTIIIKIKRNEFDKSLINGLRSSDVGPA